MRLLPLSVLISVVLCASFASAFDQSAYSRLDERFRGKWSERRVEPRWTSDSAFWYERRGSNGEKEFVQVDCESGDIEVHEAGDDLLKNDQKAWRPRIRQHGPRPTQTSPDGVWQCEIREHNLWLVNQDTRDEIQKTTDGTEANSYDVRVYWSPDSTKFVAFQTKVGTDRKVYLIESSPTDQLQPKLHSYDYLKPGDDVPLRRPRLLQVDYGEEIDVPSDLFENPWSIDTLRWKADSSSFTFEYNQRGHQVLRVVKVDAETGMPSAVVDEHQDTFIDYAGKSFSYYLDDINELIWMSERDGWNHLYLVDLESGELKNQITSGQWVVREVDHIDREDREIWFRASGIHPGQDPYYIHYSRVGFDGKDLVVMTEGDGTHEVSFSPDRNYLIDRYSRVDLPPITELRRTGDGGLVTTLEESDLEALESVGWQTPERLVSKARDGETDIYGVIFRPSDFDPSRSYPVVEDLYAGPQSSFTPKSFHLIHHHQRLAELGFIVVQLDGLGTSNRSKAFHDVCCKNLADAGLPDRKLWMKAAADQFPQMDLTRVGVMGHSAGAQSAMAALLWHNEFYKVAVCGCGCHDNRMDKIWWNELWMGWPVGPHYAEQSNVTNAHLLEGDLLLIVGELDRNVDPASTMQVVDALIKADKDFDLLVVPGRGHNTSIPYVERRKRDFLIEHLDAEQFVPLEQTAAVQDGAGA